MNTKRPSAPWKPLPRSALATALVGNIDRIGCTGVRRRVPSAAALPRADLGFLGLDLSYNAIGTEGIVALGRALLDVPGMIYLEVRGNADDVTDISHSRGGQRPSPTTAVLEEVEKACAERREQLISARLVERRATSSSCSREAPRAGKDAKSEPMEGKRGAGAKEVYGDSVEGGHEKTEICLPKKSNQRRNQNKSTITDAAMPCESNHEPSGCGRCDVGQQQGACAGTAAVGLEQRTEWPSLGKRAFGAVKPRPLEGSLPLRGYYIDPLVDSHFDLLMLREPAPNPVNPGSYVNRTRRKLEQSRLSRERRYGGSIAKQKPSPFPAGILGETGQIRSPRVECCTYIGQHCNPV